MSPHQAANQPARSQHCEALEERLALTVQAIADLPDLVQFSPSVELSSNLEPGEHVDYVRDSYSFVGSGQTVAVIDSGIAWDHYALGNGLGEDFRVVGGWDFAENDADPFDDGPAGFHGTHVAGIIGSDDTQYEGVASGVDLVGLRVFNDVGQGKLEWVEQALQWVHEHRHDFENPITTVNLSLGVNWNSYNVPEWATLEDEFAQLKKDGIFISVAAGNSFQSYLQKGLSYPAASQHVVPVASHGDNGQISDFSQRNERVLVAPGEGIQSTVPAHLFGQTGPSHQFMAASGTSMAAPYLAGASVLLREAFDVAGDADVDQATLYEHFRESADEIYDSVTRTWYSRLNLSAAIDAALEDHHGDNLATGTDLGNIAQHQSIGGILAKSGDVDYLRFTTAEAGRLTLTLSETHDLNAVVETLGTTASVHGNTLVMDVEAGQDYALKLSAGSGRGSYELGVEFEASGVTMQDLGLVRSQQVDGLEIADGSEFQLTASRNGLLTIEALFDRGEGNLSFEIFDAQGNLVATSGMDDGGARVDLQVSRGDEFVVKFSGDHSSVGMRLTNLVRTVGDRIIVGGTGGDDSYSYESGEVHRFSVNGTTYEFSREDFSKVRIHGGTGSDSVELVGTSANETLSGGAGRVVFFGGQTDVIANGFESIVVVGNGGDDLAVLRDTAADDLFVGKADHAILSGGGYRLQAEDFSRVTVLSGAGGNDVAELHGSDGTDFLHIHRNGTSLAGSGFQNYVKGFEHVEVISSSGDDQVLARGTAAREELQYVTGRLQYRNVQGVTRFSDFARVTVLSGGGNDVAQFRELHSRDSLTQEGESVLGMLSGNLLSLENFQEVEWSASIGESPDIALAAVEEIYQVYGED